MKNLLILTFIFLTQNLWAVCSSPISRTNNTANQVLTSTKYNLDLNTVYSKVNNLPGDCITDETVSTAKIADGAVTSAKLAAGVLAAFIPVATILPFAGTVAPTGFLLCNGQTVSRVTYADLYTAVGTSFGSGNGSTTFHVPDFRGRFLRGVDGGQGRDPDRLIRTAMNSGGNSGDDVGSVQTDELAGHQHYTVTNATSASSGGLNASQYLHAANNSGTNAFYTLAGGGAAANVGLTSVNGGNETRPENANVNFIIKY